eukprot:MONOS_2034.1-p1 / transcript=MONOS_2034.1 / gene=MONOS_2034 / organism=Monocercomonoides_exilis_PA203 / gene_product=transmembrane protein / transcript_product=transmembrane protein / location=Mono_scaffold00039:132065-133191(+) / protein_length=204 / sequence_SO=supercontig / SO=protein_coding / is_pseudo=false
MHVVLDSVNEPPTVDDCINLEDPERDLYPFSVVWTVIPFLTWLCPIVGHVGICDSQGRVWDFQKSKTIIIDRMKYHRPIKVWRFFRATGTDVASQQGRAHLLLSNRRIPEQWDRIIVDGSNLYTQYTYHWKNRNSYHHVAECLNRVDPNSSVHYRTSTIIWRLLKEGKFVRKSSILVVYLPLIILLLLLIIIILLVVTLATRKH